MRTDAWVRGWVLRVRACVLTAECLKVAVEVGIAEPILFGWLGKHSSVIPPSDPVHDVVRWARDVGESDRHGREVHI